MKESEEQRLFELAMAELEGATRSKIQRMKRGQGIGGEGLPVQDHHPQKHHSATHSDHRNSEERLPDQRRLNKRRLDKRRKSAVPDYTIDLHGLPRKPALARLRGFVTEHRRADLLLVIHGKGRGILRHQVVRFLDAEPAVVEHLKAPARLGGGGARLVRMRS